jgi:hypothetical protein
MSDADGKPSAASAVSAVAIDTAAKTNTFLGSSQVLFLRQGQLHTVDLRQLAAPAPRRVSALSDACRIDQVDAIDAAGDEAWVAVTTAGSDGRCDTDGDNAQRMVRTGMAGTDTPLAWPAATSQHEALRAPDGSLLGFAVLTGATLDLYGSDLAKRGPVAGAGSMTAFDDVASRTGERVKYLRVGLNLHRLDYDAAAATLSAPLLSFAAEPSGDFAVSGWDHAYVASGREIYSLSTTATPMAALGAAGARVTALELTDSHLAAAARESAGTTTWWSVHLDTRQIRPLVPPAGTELPGVSPMLLGSRGGTVYAQRWVGSSESDLSQELITLPVDGSAGSVLRSGVVYAGVLFDASARAHTLPLQGLLFCEPVLGRSDCATAPIYQWSLPGGSAVPLGRAGSVGSDYSLFGYGFAGRPFVMTAQRGLAMDMLVATGDVAESLVPMSAFTRNAGGR